MSDDTNMDDNSINYDSMDISGIQNDSTIATTPVSHTHFSGPIEDLLRMVFPSGRPGGGFSTIAELIDWDDHQPIPFLHWPYSKPFKPCSRTFPEWSAKARCTLSINIVNYRRPNEDHVSATGISHINHLGPIRCWLRKIHKFRGRPGGGVFKNVAQLIHWDDHQAEPLLKWPSTGHFNTWTRKEKDAMIKNIINYRKQIPTASTFSIPPTIIDIETGFRCEQCDTVFPTAEELASHRVASHRHKTHPETPSTVINFRCSCNLGFSHLDQFEVHREKCSIWNVNLQCVEYRKMKQRQWKEEEDMVKRHLKELKENREEGGEEMAERHQSERKELAEKHEKQERRYQRCIGWTLMEGSDGL